MGGGGVGGGWGWRGWVGVWSLFANIKDWQGQSIVTFDIDQAKISYRLISGISHQIPNLGISFPPNLGC